MTTKAEKQPIVAQKKAKKEPIVAQKKPRKDAKVTQTKVKKDSQEKAVKEAMVAQKKAEKEAMVAQKKAEKEAMVAQKKAEKEAMVAQKKAEKEAMVAQKKAEKEPKKQAEKKTKNVKAVSNDGLSAQQKKIEDDIILIIQYMIVHEFNGDVNDMAFNIIGVGAISIEDRNILKISDVESSPNLRVIGPPRYNKVEVVKDVKHLFAKSFVDDEEFVTTNNMLWIIPSKQSREDIRNTLWHIYGDVLRKAKAAKKIQ